MSARKNGMGVGGKAFQSRLSSQLLVRREARAGTRTSWQARTPLQSHHSKILTINSSGRIVREAWLGRSTGLWRATVEASIASGGRKGVTESPRVSRDTMVMVAIVCQGGDWVRLEDAEGYMSYHRSPVTARRKMPRSQSYSFATVSPSFGNRPRSRRADLQMVRFPFQFSVTAEIVSLPHHVPMSGLVISTALPLSLTPSSLLYSIDTPQSL